MNRLLDGLGLLLWLLLVVLLLAAEGGLRW